MQAARGWKRFRPADRISLWVGEAYKLVKQETNGRSQAGHEVQRIKAQHALLSLALCLHGPSQYQNSVSQQHVKPGQSCFLHFL